MFLLFLEKLHGALNLFTLVWSLYSMLTVIHYFGIVLWWFISCWPLLKYDDITTQPAFTSSKSTTETLKQCEICSKLLIKIIERCHWRRFGGVSLLIISRFHSFFWCFRSKYRLSSTCSTASVNKIQAGRQIDRSSVKVNIKSDIK